VTLPYDDIQIWNGSALRVVPGLTRAQLRQELVGPRALRCERQEFRQHTALRSAGAAKVYSASDSRTHLHSVVQLGGHVWPDAQAAGTQICLQAGFAGGAT
jgi:hypothetical protein